MNPLKKLFGKKETAPIAQNPYEAFWKWFQAEAIALFKIVKNSTKPAQIEKGFIHKVSPRLRAINENFQILTGMESPDTAELIVTVDGSLKHMVFVEELIACAPAIPGWKFTAHKPAHGTDFEIEMQGYKFGPAHMQFYGSDIPGYPDEIVITLVHNDWKAKDEDVITNGAFIYLDTFLGEWEVVTSIDKVRVIGKKDAEKELVPLEKLPAYLEWRKKEYVEKYEGVRHNTENDTYHALQAELESGCSLLAIINTDLLEWDHKASHPWVAVLEIHYDGSRTHGMPDEKTFSLLAEMEDAIIEELKDVDGYLNIGRQTAEGQRLIYFACKDFRKPAQVFTNIIQQHSPTLEIDFEIYKDKYWQTFEQFRP